MLVRPESNSRPHDLVTARCSTNWATDAVTVLVTVSQNLGVVEFSPFELESAAVRLWSHFAEPATRLRWSGYCSFLKIWDVSGWMFPDVPEIGWTSTICLLSELCGQGSLTSALRPGLCFVSHAFDERGACGVYIRRDLREVGPACSVKVPSSHFGSPQKFWTR